MSVRTSKASYRQHEYSGSRKSLKRVRSGLRRYHAEVSRLKAWRSEGMKKEPMNEEIVIDNSIITQNTPIRIYGRVKPKICLESTNSAPSTSTVTAEPLEINWPILMKQESTSENVIHVFCSKCEMEVPHTAEEIQQKQESTSENVIHVFCSKCETEVPHTAEGIQQDQTKILIAKVYHYFEQEYEELKKICRNVDLTPLSKFRKRTARATGVSESVLQQILQEEEGRRDMTDPPRGGRAAKIRRHADTSAF